MHFDLDSPASPKTKLVPHHADGNIRVYRCPATSTYWALYMNNDGDRFLSPMNIGNGKSVLDKKVQHRVPDNWTGDRATVYVDDQKIQDAQNTRGSGTLLPQGIIGLVENGDQVIVVDYYQQEIGEYVKSGDQVIFKAKNSP